MVTNVPQPPVDDQAMLGGMGAMLGGGAPGGAPVDPMMGATEAPISEGGDSEVIAHLAMENVQLRALLGLGPDDPVPMDPELGGAPGPGGDPGMGGAPGGDPGAPAL